MNTGSKARNSHTTYMSTVQNESEKCQADGWASKSLTRGFHDVLGMMDFEGTVRGVVGFIIVIYS